ncbi:hypothetical protein ABW19_dt0203404 [Dactylella cylindrospora]|nr:hypothetical protein ABW19_dt0203404 [Dactylella cylindrospora]
MDAKKQFLPESEYNNIYALIDYNELEPWQKDNEYILTGYRKLSYSYYISLRSILQIHNETGNIWTHLLAALLFLYSLSNFITTSLPTLRSSASSTDILAISIYYITVINAWALSTNYHTFTNHSHDVHKFGNELDHLGIVLVVWGSAIPASYFAFRDVPGITRYVHYFINTVLAIACGYVTLRPKFRHPQYKIWRFYVYLVLVTSALLTVGQGWYMFGFEEMDRRMGVRNFLMLGVWQTTGGIVYAARAPERWVPKRFDNWGHSHQLMHVLVVCGAVCNEWGLLRAVEYWASKGVDVN